MKFCTRIVSLCELSIGHIPFLDGVGLSKQLLISRGYCDIQSLKRGDCDSWALT